MFESFGSLPDILLACVGGGSNAMGLFHPFVKETSVRLIGVEAAEAELILTNMLPLSLKDQLEFCMDQ